MLINKYIYNLENLPAYCTETLSHLKKTELLEIENTVIARFDKFGPTRICGISYNTRWILTAKLNMIEREVLKVSTSIC